MTFKPTQLPNTSPDQGAGLLIMRAPRRMGGRPKSCCLRGAIFGSLNVQKFKHLWRISSRRSVRKTQTAPAQPPGPILFLLLSSGGLFYNPLSRNLRSGIHFTLEVRTPMGDPKSAKLIVFEIPEPATNYTRIPHAFLDLVMRHLNGSEVGVYLAICRLTLGWNRPEWTGKSHEICDLAGIHHTSFHEAIRRLEEWGLIHVDRDPGKESTYAIRFAGDGAPPRKSGGVGTVDPPGKAEGYPPGKAEGSADSVLIDSSLKESIKETHSPTPLPETESKTCQPLSASHVVKAIQQAAEEVGLGKVTIPQRDSKKLRDRDNWARQTDEAGDAWTEYRERLRQALISYAEDPSIGTLAQALLNVRYGSPSVSRERATVAHDLPQRRTAPKFLPGITGAIPEIPAWKLADLETCQVLDPEGFADRWTAHWAKYGNNGASAAAVVGAFWELEQERAKLKRSRRRNNDDDLDIAAIVDEVVSKGDDEW